MLKFLKNLDEASNKWMEARIYKKGLAGKGPWVIYRCQKCWGAFYEVDIIGPGRSGVCPRCQRNRFECAYISPIEYIRFFLRALFGKSEIPKEKK